MSHLISFIATLVLVAFPALATTSPPTAPAPGPTGGGIGDYWWLILVVIIVAVAIWYFTRRNRTSV